ncbi:MAG: hypothetical protein ABSC06_25640 [Rhodopila sp.]|jgi:hypothetical protein
MQLKPFLASLVIGTTVIAFAAQAQGFLGGQAELDPKFCEATALRQTVVYVDDMFMQDGQTDWAGKLYDKLRATLIPGERVTVVELSPADGQSRDAWTGCWPDHSQEERDRLGKSLSFFSKNPLKALEDQQGFFGSGFGGALSAIYDKHHQPKAIIDPSAAPAKAIIGALASDGARYAQTKVTIRAILYSDLAENSELASVFKPQPQPAVNFGKKLGTYLRSSVFYAFGVGGDVGGGQEVRETTRTLWTAVLSSMSATVAGLGSDLTVPNALPVSAREFTIDLKENDQPLSGRMSLLADADGGLIDSWIGIVRLSSASLSGTMRCEAGGNGICTINAATSHGILSDSASEVLTLRGDESKPLTGLIGVRGSSVMFPLTATINATR